MVFSAGLREADFGTAIVIPCKSQDLVKEAECLWLAERPLNSSPNGRISADWGCIALLTKPVPPIPEELRACWTNRVSRESCYGQLLNSAVGEEVVVDKSGFLNIPGRAPRTVRIWGSTRCLRPRRIPQSLAAGYPLAQQIADAWKDGKDFDYFRKNREHGIETFQTTRSKVC